MERGSIEISTFEPSLAPGALAASDRSGAHVELSSAEVALPGCDHANFARGMQGSFPFSSGYRSRDVFPGRRLATGATAACIALALHALLLTSILWTGESPVHRPRDSGALNKVVPEGSEDGALQVVFIQDPSSSQTAERPFKSIRLASASALEVIAVADALAEQTMSVPNFSVELATSVATPAPDAALRSAQYGRYVGQIDARIERAWRRPRAAIGAPVFACVVRIDQDARGTVLEVTLEQCNGSERWQLSLVSAIESASPLPAPPDPAVFTRTLHMSFQSRPYSPGEPQDAYEPVLAAQRVAGTGTAEEQNERTPRP